MRREPCFTGAMVELHRHFVREQWGDEVLRMVLAALPSRDADEIRNAHPIQWVPLRAVEAFYEALARLLGEPVEDVHARVVRFSVAQRFRPIRRVLMRLASDARLLGRASALYRRTYNVGRLEARVTGAGRGELHLRSWPEVTDFALRGLRLGVGQLLEDAGRRQVSLTCQRTDDGAVFTASWASPALLQP
ncbi:MAG: hypothetical protein ACFCGT_13955 [Sandaracinaceae bacterium]